MMGASQKEFHCDLLIIDEYHRAASSQISNVFNVIKYKLILGLTATFERLDGQHELLSKYAPVCDTISIQEAMLNGWVSSYKEYVVVLNVEDIQTYKNFNKVFQEALSFFDWDFNLALSLNTHEKIVQYTSKICKNDEDWKTVYKRVLANHNTLMRTLQQRKKFIAEHPDKVRVAQKIIDARKDKKIVTFCSSVKMAESFGNGMVFTGKNGKKKNRISLEEFANMESGVIHSAKLFIEGINVPDISVGIMLGVNSSKTKATQSLGRILRLSPGKKAEFFTIVINDTVETKWLENSRSNNNFEIIDETALDHLLNNEPYEQYKRKLSQFSFRY